MQTLSLKVNDIHLWSDSSDVLCWLKDRPSRWPVFVASRCSDIISMLPSAYWHQVRSRDNPTDSASIGIETPKMQDLSLWWNGHAWLTAESVPWPVATAISVAEYPENSSISLNLNVKNKTKRACLLEPWDLVERYSSLSKWPRITAYCVRFICKLNRRCLQKKPATTNLKLLNLEFWEDKGNAVANHPTIQELNSSRLLWVHLHQMAHFAEISYLSNGRPLNSRSSLLRLNPVPKKGLLRFGGRLRNSLLDDQSKQPLILLHGTSLTKLLVRHAHHHASRRSAADAYHSATAALAHQG